jgi:uncharacterized linocin/CFP29 family protein
VTHLLRDLAPISTEGWAAIDEEVQRALRAYLAARKLVDFSGPHGWQHSAANLGRVVAAKGPKGAPVEASVRAVQPLVELRARFEIQRAEIDAIDRGSLTPDLDPAIGAARALAGAEDKAVFHGDAAAGIEGLSTASPHDALAISDDYEEYPRPVAKAVARLREAGVDGPYGIALGPRCYTGVIETTQRGGYPVLEHLRLILGGPVVWAPAVDGAVVLSLRGGDFELVCGQDASIGFESSTAESVALYVEESLTFRVHGPEAAIALVYP